MARLSRLGSLREILNFGRPCIFLDALHTGRHASHGIIYLAGSNNLMIGGLKDKVVLPILTLSVLVTVRIRAVLLHRGDAVHAGCSRFISLTGQNRLAIRCFQSEAKLTLLVLVDLEFPCRVIPPLESGRPQYIGNWLGCQDLKFFGPAMRGVGLQVCASPRNRLAMAKEAATRPILG
jgi:hypothetical protein